MGSVKSNYVLTEEQRKIVEDNHNLIYHYIKINGLALDEYYDLLAIALCKAAALYKAGENKFSTFAFVCFDSIIKSTWRVNNYAKRKPQQGILSLDAEYEFQEDGSVKTLKDIIGDNFSLEENIFDKILIEEINAYISTLSSKDQYIFYESVKGRTFVDIAKELNYSKQNIHQRYHNVLKRIKKLFNI